MGGIHRFVGFLENKDSLNQIDLDFRELVKLSYYIPGFGSHGVSCSGHFELEEEGQEFNPVPWGSLGFMALPEMEHIPPLLKLIYDQTKKDQDAIIVIDNGKGAPRDRPRYDPRVKLKPYAKYRTENGLYVARIDLLLGDNDCLKELGEYYGGSIPLNGNERTFEKSQKRCAEMKDFWKNLEGAVRDYNIQHNFLHPDFQKREFFPPKEA